MDALETILTRRSIRKYTEEPVSVQDIETILKAAMSAPSAGNEQAWQFVVINDRVLLDEIPNVHPYSQMLFEATVAILVCGDLTLEKNTGYWVQDCAAATENLLLAVKALGLGAVWTGVYPREDRMNGIRSILGLPEQIIPFSLIPIGHPAEDKPPAERFDPTRVHKNGW